jgi:hypothetical protein
VLAVHCPKTRGDIAAGYILGKLLFEAGDRHGAYKAISEAMEKESNAFTWEDNTWSVKFTDGERRATYSDYIDIVTQSIDQQPEYESMVGNLIKRVHLLKVDQITMILSLKQFTLPGKQKVELLVNLGGALAKEHRFAEAAGVFAEARRYTDGEQKLRVMMSELKMRSESSEPLETLGRLVDAVETQRSNMQPPPSDDFARFLDMKIGFWRCEIAVRSRTNGDDRCRKVLANATYSDKILAAYYGGQFALMRDDREEWLKLLEKSIKENDSYNSPAAFNEVEVGPRDLNAVFETMLRDLAAYYGRSGDFTKIGNLLFRDWKFEGRSIHYFEGRRLDVLQAVILR